MFVKKIISKHFFYKKYVNSCYKNYIFYNNICNNNDYNNNINIPSCSINDLYFIKFINNDKNFVIFDVRNKFEIDNCEFALYFQKFHYINHTLHDLYYNEKLYDSIPHNKLIITVCKSGKRGNQMTWLLNNKNYNAINLENGINGLNKIKMNRDLF